MELYPFHKIRTIHRSEVSEARIFANLPSSATKAPKLQHQQKWSGDINRKQERLSLKKKRSRSQSSLFSMHNKQEKHRPDIKYQKRSFRAPSKYEPKIRIHHQREKTEKVVLILERKRERSGINEDNNSLVIKGQQQNRQILGSSRKINHLLDKNMRKDLQKSFLPENQHNIIDDRLGQANSKINLVAEIAKIVGSCVSEFKKSNLKWYSLTALLYLRCSQTFKHYEQVYGEAAQKAIITENEMERFVKDRQTISTNMQKIIRIGKKKKILKSEYQESLNHTSENELGKLIQEEAFCLWIQIRNSQNSCDPEIQGSFLRMLNAVVMLWNLQGQNENLFPNEQELSPASLNSSIQKKLRILKSLK